MKKVLGYVAAIVLGISAGQAFGGDVQVDATGYNCTLTSATTNTTTAQTSTCSTGLALQALRLDNKGYSLYLGSGSVGASVSVADNDNLHVGVQGSNNSFKSHTTTATTTSETQSDNNSVGLFVQERAKFGEFTLGTFRNTATGANASSGLSAESKVWLPLAGDHWKSYFDLTGAFAAYGADQQNAKVYTGSASLGVRVSI